MAVIGGLQVNLFCADVEACLAFYGRLGLPERFRYPRSGPIEQVAAGATVVAPPMNSPDGRLRYAWIRDPEGHQLKLVQERRFD